MTTGCLLPIVSSHDNGGLIRGRGGGGDEGERRNRSRDRDIIMFSFLVLLRACGYVYLKTSSQPM